METNTAPAAVLPGQAPLERQFSDYCRHNNLTPATDVMRSLHAVVALRTPERLDTYQNCLRPEASGAGAVMKSVGGVTVSPPSELATSFLNYLLDNEALQSDMAELAERVATERLVVAIHYPLEEAIRIEDELRPMAIGIELSEDHALPSKPLLDEVSGQRSEDRAQVIPDVMLAQLSLSDQLVRYCETHKLNDWVSALDNLSAVVTLSEPPRLAEAHMALAEAHKALGSEATSATLFLREPELSSTMIVWTAELDDLAGQLESSLANSGTLDTSPELRDQLGAKALLVGISYPVKLAIQYELELRELATGIEIRGHGEAAKPSEDVIDRATRSPRFPRP